MFQIEMLVCSKVLDRRDLILKWTFSLHDCAGCCLSCKFLYVLKIKMVVGLFVQLWSEYLNTPSAAIQSFDLWWLNEWKFKTSIVEENRFANGFLITLLYSSKLLMGIAWFKNCESTVPGSLLETSEIVITTCTD